MLTPWHLSTTTDYTFSQLFLGKETGTLVSSWKGACFGNWNAIWVTEKETVCVWPSSLANKVHLQYCTLSLNICPTFFVCSYSYSSIWDFVDLINIKFMWLNKGFLVVSFSQAVWFASIIHYMNPSSSAHYTDSFSMIKSLDFGSSGPYIMLLCAFVARISMTDSETHRN